MKIDAFSHVRPRAYADVVERLVGSSAGMARFGGGRAGAAAARPGMAPLWDAGLRIKHLDDAEVDKQVITHTVPPIEQATAAPAATATPGSAWPASTPSAFRPPRKSECSAATC